MTLLKHELRLGKTSFLLWTAGISFMLGICILIYPEMAGQMNELSTMFAEMGSFTAAFGMDQLNFGEFKGYFGIECGNTLGIGGALFAALIGISALAKEEKEHTAEFLLTHPITRERIFAEKLFSVILQVVLMNCIVAVFTVGTTVIIGESLPWRESIMLMIAYLLMQLEIAIITFGLSAYLNGGNIGIGLGLALLLYCTNLISNLIENGKNLKYITPYAYADSAHIFTVGTPEVKYILSGWAIAIIVLTAGYFKYRKKDIA